MITLLTPSVDHSSKLFCTPSSIVPVAYSFHPSQCRPRSFQRRPSRYRCSLYTKTNKCRVTNCNICNLATRRGEKACSLNLKIRHHVHFHVTRKIQQKLCCTYVLSLATTIPLLAERISMKIDLQHHLPSTSRKIFNNIFTSFRFGSVVDPQNARLLGLVV